MVNIEKYMKDLLEVLQQEFGKRLLYVGLQGSYLRNEATEESDLDIMTVIDGFSVGDLDTYKKAVIAVGEYDKACGFICGKQDLLHWNPMEICHLLHTTRDYYGLLAELVPVYTEEDVRNFVKMSLNNLYHEICHRYIFTSQEKNEFKMIGTYKGVFFILQNLHYLRTGIFAGTKKELLTLLHGKDREILETAMKLSKDETYEFEKVFELLFLWCQETLEKL